MHLVRPRLSHKFRHIGNRDATARQHGVEKTESVQQAIEERPLTAVLIAFCVGLLAGKILAKAD